MYLNAAVENEDIEVKLEDNDNDDTRCFGVPVVTQDRSQRSEGVVRRRSSRAVLCFRPSDFGFRSRFTAKPKTEADRVRAKLRENFFKQGTLLICPSLLMFASCPR